MKPSPVQSSSPISRHFLPLKVACFVLIFTLSSFAKDAPLSAIVLFDSRTGSGYVQATGVTLNGKTELRSCDGVPKFDKRSYDVLPRVQLKPSAILERNADGVLMLSMDSAKPFCVVTNGVKFDKNPELTPAQAADQAVFLGLVAQSSMQPAELPPVKPGVQFVFVAAPDTEFAEYLRAQRAQSAALWQEYLKRYPASAHSVQAKQALAAMLIRSAESAIAEYARSASSDAPQLSLLKQTRNDAAQIEALGGGRAAADKVLQAIHAQLDLLLERNRHQLQSFNKAVAEHTGSRA
jgi:hypothetical protein